MAVPCPKPPKKRGAGDRGGPSPLRLGSSTQSHRHVPWMDAAPSQTASRQGTGFGKQREHPLMSQHHQTVTNIANPSQPGTPSPEFRSPQPTYPGAEAVGGCGRDAVAAVLAPGAELGGHGGRLVNVGHGFRALRQRLGLLVALGVVVVCTIVEICQRKRRWGVSIPEMPPTSRLVAGARGGTRTPGEASHHADSDRAPSCNYPGTNEPVSNTWGRAGTRTPPRGRQGMLRAPSPASA